VIAPLVSLAAKEATATIPIVFSVGFDPVAAGLVASFNRSGGNATGVTLVTAPLGQKLLELVPRMSLGARACVSRNRSTMSRLMAIGL
jgi:ABC-type uncharacterized transport system substrate-binding protein